MPENVSVHDLAAAIERGEPVIDVRTPVEFAAGHVPSAVLIPMQAIPAQYEDLRGHDAPIYVICEVGSSCESHQRKPIPPPPEIRWPG